MYIMSQGDYIKYKRVANELLSQSKLAPVLNARQYTNYKEFNIENTVLNSAVTYDKLNLPNMAIVYDIRQTRASTCPGFTLCRGTNARANRKPLMGVQSAAQPLAKEPSHVLPSKLFLCSYCEK